MPEEEERKFKRADVREHASFVLTKVKVPSPLQGFVDFIREQGVVGLAVGFVLGVAAKAVVDSIVNNLINPVVGLYGAGGKLADKYWCLKTIEGQCTNKLGYGAVISQIISFLIVAGVIYFVIKGLKLDKLDKKKEDTK